jgi:hypothetical protein
MFCSYCLNVISGTNKVGTVDVSNERVTVAIESAHWHTLPVGVNEFLSVLSAFLVRYGSDSL